MARIQQSYSWPSFGVRLSVLLTTLLASLITVEFLSNVMHDRRTATLRAEGGVRDALVIHSSPGRQQLLFAGNSLIYDDLSKSDLQQSLGPGFVVHTAGVPGSTYHDWSYGLHALFARGSQPDVLVFGISPSQFLRAPAVTPVPVSLLWNPRQILSYQRQAHLNLTQTTELFLEHYSTYYALRNTIRIYVRKGIPGYEAMVDNSTGSASDSSQPTKSEPSEIFTEKLRRLATECGAHTQFILMLSPTNQIEDEKLEPALRNAAESLNIPVIAPVAERQWPLTQFRDDQYHLTAKAAAEFSRLVATDLRQKLTDSSSRISGQ